MRREVRSRFLAYGVGLGGPLLVWIARLAATPWLGDRAQFIPYALPLVLAAWVGGLGPGLVATAAATLLSYFPLVRSTASIPMPGPTEPFSIAVLAFVGITISLLLGRLHAARRRLEENEERLRTQIDQRLLAEATLEAERREAERIGAESERALKESEAEARSRADELETILRAAPAAIWIAHDPDCVQMTSNPAAARLLRATSMSDAAPTRNHESGASGWREMPGGRALARNELPVQRAARGAEMRECELSFVLADGEERRIFGSAVPLYDADAKPRGAIGAFVDITGVRQAEAALRAAKEELDIVTVSMAAPVAHCTRDLRYRWVSQPYADWIGRTAAEIAGKPIVEILGTEAFDRLRHYFDLVLTGTDVRYEEEVDFRGIGPRWIDATYKPTYGSGGEPDGWVSVVLDITERKRAEQALRASEERLREADRRKDEFLATLAHELRNPLAPIASALDVLEAKGSPEPEVAWSRGVIRRQLDHLVRLIGDLVDVSRITRGRLELQRERVELATVVESAVEASRPNFDAKGPTLDVRLPAESVWLDGDRMRLSQIFTNLLNNAAKFTPRGGRVELFAERRDGQVAISVRDDGVGIPPELTPRLFEIFAQAAPTGERTRDGLGIGLALSRALAERHGGRIEARSDGPGRGSEFRVHLPLAAAPEAPEPFAPMAPASPVAPLRLLVAEDNPDVAEALAAVLRTAGHDVRVAADGIEAIAAAEKFRPQVALLDIGMPRLNGYETARRIREAPWGRDVVLIAVTGWGQENDRKLSQEAGFDRHLVKPITTAALEGALRELLPTA